MITRDGFIQQCNIIKAKIAAIENIADVLRRVALDMIYPDRLIVVVANNRSFGLPGQRQYPEAMVLSAPFFRFNNVCGE